MGFLEVWMEALTKPVETFRREKRKANLGEGAKHVLVAGVIAGVLGAIGIALFGVAAVSGLEGVSGLAADAAMVGMLFAVPIGALLQWFIGSAVLLLFAKLLGGKGDYTLQSWLIALYFAPITAIGGVLVLIPVVGGIISFFVMLYGLHLLTLALRETHGYTSGKAVLTWLIPLGIVLVIALLLGVALFAGMLEGAAAGFAG